MHPSFTPPRQVGIDDAAVFVGISPEEIRRYQDIGLLPGPDDGADGSRRYGYDDVIRLLWITTMADAGTSVDEIRDALGATTPLASRARLLADVVADRLESLPEGSLRQSDLDTLLVTERIFGALGAAIQATRFIAVASRPDLREQSDRVDAAEEALDDTVAVDDPRVAQVAAERHAFERALDAAIEESGLARSDEELVDSAAEAHSVTAGDGTVGSGHGFDGQHRSLSTIDAVGKMPYDFSPARLRALEITMELAIAELSHEER